MGAGEQVTRGSTRIDVAPQRSSEDRIKVQSLRPTTTSAVTPSGELHMHPAAHPHASGCAAASTRTPVKNERSCGIEPHGAATSGDPGVFLVIFSWLFLAEYVTHWFCT